MGEDMLLFMKCLGISMMHIFRSPSFSMGQRNKLCKKAVPLPPEYRLNACITMRNLLLFIVLTMLAVCSVECRPKRQTSAQAVYDQALDAFGHDSTHAGESLLRDAIRLAERESDEHTLYLSQLRLAEVLSWGNTEAAVEMAKQALQTYERHPDSERNHIIILDYIGTYASQRDYNAGGTFAEARSYTHRAYQLAEASRDSLGDELVSQTLTSMANILWAMERYDSALVHARLAEACAPPHLLVGAQQVLARCLASCEHFAEAESVYCAMKPEGDIQMEYIVQSSLAKLALHRSDLHAAEASIDSAFEHAEVLYFDALAQKDEYYRSALAEERENEHLRYASALQRRTLWGVLCVVLVLVMAAISIVRSRLRLNAQRQLAELWRRKHKVDERLDESRLRRLEAERYQQELQRKEQELRIRDSSIDFLKDYILQRSEVIRKLGASRERHVALTAREWSDVERTLNAIDGDRFLRLRQRYSELRDEDIQLCILIRLNLSNRAVGNIFGLTISAVQHRKLRLKKEVFGESRPDVTLEQVLVAF